MHRRCFDVLCRPGQIASELYPELLGLFPPAKVSTSSQTVHGTSRMYGQAMSMPGIATGFWQVPDPVSLISLAIPPFRVKILLACIA